MILLTLLYVVDRMTDKLADVNNQSTVGMFSYHDVLPAVCEMREDQEGSDPSKSMRDPRNVVICRDPGWVP